MKQKAAKARRQEQLDFAEALDLDVAQLIKKTEAKFENYGEAVVVEFARQRKRLQELFAKISDDKDFKESGSARFLLTLVDHLDIDGLFIRDFTKRVATIIENDYSEDMEPFYNNMFDILNPSVQEKVKLIQSLEKSGGAEGVKLSLSDEENAERDKMIAMLRQKIKNGMPKVFDSKLIYKTTLVPIEDIFKIAIDNESLQTMLKLRTISSNNANPQN